MAKEQAAAKVAEAAPAAAAPAAKKKGVTKHATPFQHVFLVDINDNGQLREVAIVKEDANGSLYYVDIMSMDNFDKARLKKIVTSQHADKYPLWDLMSQTTLSNGKNALDYFHQLVRVKYAAGHVNTGMGGGLAGPLPRETGNVIGTGFTDPGSGTIDGTKAIG